MIMHPLDSWFSEYLKCPVCVDGIKDATFKAETGDVPEITATFLVYPKDCEGHAEEEIPFCDKDCENCCESDDLDEYFDIWCPDGLSYWGLPDVSRIIFSPPATIVFWDDGTKTVVKCMEGEKFEKYAGFAMACMKKLFGSTSRAKAIMRECAEEAVVKTKEKKDESPAE